MLRDMKANAPERKRVLLTLAPSGVERLDDLADTFECSRLEVIRAALRFAFLQQTDFEQFLTRHLEV